MAARRARFLINEAIEKLGLDPNHPHDLKTLFSQQVNEKKEEDGPPSFARMAAVVMEEVSPAEEVVATEAAALDQGVDVIPDLPLEPTASVAVGTDLDKKKTAKKKK